MDSMSGSVRGEGWEVCGSEATQPSNQAGATGKIEAAAAEVGVLHSIADLLALDAEYREQLRESAGREGTCSDACKRSEGQGDGPRGIQTPAKARKLQIALYRRIVAIAGKGRVDTPPNGMKRCDQTDPDSRIREIRPSGSMRGEVETRN